MAYSKMFVRKDDITTNYRTARRSDCDSLVRTQILMSWSAAINICT